MIRAEVEVAEVSARHDQLFNVLTVYHCISQLTGAVFTHVYPAVPQAKQRPTAPSTHHSHTRDIIIIIMNNIIYLLFGCKRI